MDQETRIDAYRNYKVSEMRAHDLVIKALDCRAVTVTQIPAVLDAYRNPKHDEFMPRNAWSWFNAVTEVLKSSSLITLPSRTQPLHGMLDHQVGLLDTLAKNVGEN
jgi:hypothetical protein